MSEPLYVGYYKITWSPKRQKFVVKSINGSKVLHESSIGKDCYDWAVKQGVEKKIHYSEHLDFQSMCGVIGDLFDNRIEYVTCARCLEDEKWHLENVSMDKDKLTRTNNRILELEGEEE